MAELRIGLNPTPMVAGGRQAENALRRVTTQARTTESAVARVGAASGRTSHQARMLGMQLSQVGQQTMATGNFVQALAIQLPDIGLAFGTVGIAAGLLAGIALPTVMAAFGATGDASKTAAEKVGEYRDALDALGEATTTVTDLQRDYADAVLTGQSGVAERLLRELEIRTALLEISRIELELSQSAATAQRDVQLDIVQAIERELAIRREMLATTQAAAGTVEFDAIAKSIEEIETRLTAAQLELNKFAKEGELSELHLEAVDNAIESATAATAALAAGGRDAAAAFADAADQASAMAQAIAAANAGRLALARRDASQIPGEGANEVALGRYNDQQSMLSRFRVRAGRTGGGARGGGGGGESAAARIGREFETLRGQIDPAFAALTRFNNGVETLDAALAAGLIGSTEEYNTLLEQMRERFLDAGDAAQGMQDVANIIEQSMTDAFMGIIDGTLSAEEAFKQMARNIIAELFRVLVVQRLVGQFESGGGGILGGIFSLFGGARAQGGNVDGGRAYLVGERGPEIFQPAGSGRIVPNAGRSIVVNQTINVEAGVSQTVRAEMLALMPAMREATKSAVRDDMQRHPGGW